MKKVLIVEDELHIGELLKKNFEINNFCVQWITDGSVALDKILVEEFDVVILDIMLPKVDGLTILKHLKKIKKHIPVIMLSSKQSFDDRILGLELQADDYLGKPFDFRELLLRVKNLLRNNVDKKSLDVLIINDWKVDKKNLEARKENQMISLSQQEYDLIFYFYQNKNNFLSRGELLKNVWKIDPKTKTRSVDIFISRLRKYFEVDPTNPKIFISKRMKGYMLKI